MEFSCTPPPPFLLLTFLYYRFPISAPKPCKVGVLSIQTPGIYLFMFEGMILTCLKSRAMIRFNTVICVSGKSEGALVKATYIF